MAIPVYELPLPEYSVIPPASAGGDWKPDYATLGPVIDRFVVEHFPGRRLALRGVFLDDHPELSRDELIALIQQHGTDRYDPAREGMHHGWYESMGVELHVVTCAVTEELEALEDEDYRAAPSFMGEFLADFYESALAERGHSLRIDLLLAFDLDPLVAVPADDPQGYAFKNPDAKQQALVGIVNILRGP